MRKIMSEKLKDILASKTKEQFEKEWAAIESLGLEGPTAKEILDYFVEFKSYYVEYFVPNDDSFFSYYNYSLAA